MGNEIEGNLVPEVDDLRPVEAIEVLRRLSRRSDAVGDAVRQEILTEVLGFDPEEVSEEVLTDLELLTVEELWDRSGRTLQGYVDPQEESWVMIEEVLRPHVARIRQYQNWERANEAREYCFAVLAGLYAFGREATSEFKEHAQDDPQMAYGWVKDSWREGVKKITLLDDFSAEVEARFPEWEK